MTDYRDIRYRFPTINLDGTTEGSPAEGDIWYDSGKFYLGTSQSFSGVWSSGGNLGTGRRDLAGCGTQSAGLCMGGRDGSVSNVTEEYNPVGSYEELFTPSTGL